jgi:hypothetical protein
LFVVFMPLFSHRPNSQLPALVPAPVVSMATVLPWVGNHPGP